MDRHAIASAVTTRVDRVAKVPPYRFREKNEIPFCGSYGNSGMLFSQSGTLGRGKMHRCMSANSPGTPQAASINLVLVSAGSFGCRVEAFRGFALPAVVGC